MISEINNRCNFLCMYQFFYLNSTIGVAVLNEQIYAVGGFDGSTGLNSAEVLDLSVSSPILQSVAGYLDPVLNENRRKR